MDLSDVMQMARFEQHGLRLRETQEGIAHDVMRVLRSPLRPPKTIRRRDGATVDLYQATAGLIEASTGTGKTLGYLIPALLHQRKTRQRILVSTYTRALQRQIAREDLPLAIGLTGSAPTWALRMGRANFIAPSRVRSLGERLSDADRNSASWQEFFDWVHAWDESTDPMDTTFAAWREEHGDLPVLSGQEMVEDMVALGDDDPPEDAFWYTLHAQAASSADLVVTNHATLLLQGFLGESLLGGAQVAIIDEADRLIDAAMAMLQRRVRPGLLLARALRRNPHQVTDSARQRVRAIEQLLLDIEQQTDGDEIGMGALVERFPQQAQTILDHLKALQLPLSRSDARALNEVVACLDRAVQKDLAKDDEQMAATLSFSPVRRLPSFAIDPIDARPALSALFNQWEKPAALTHAVLLSATLNDPLEPQADVARHYAIDPDTVVVRSRHEPDRFGRMTLVLPDSRLGSPMTRHDDGSREFNPAWVRSVLGAIDTDRDWRKLVLVPSFADVRAMLAARGLPSEPNQPDRTILHDGVLYHQPDKPGHRLLQSLRDPQVRAIVTPSFWEGVNLVVDGRLWMRDLLIARMPISPFSEMRVNRLVEYMVHDRRFSGHGAARNFLFLQAASAAVRRLRQGIGRGIRGANDQIRVWLLDPDLMLPADWLSAWETVAIDDDEVAQARVHAAQHSQGRAAHPALRNWRAALPRRFLSVAQEASWWINGRLIDFPA